MQSQRKRSPENKTLIAARELYGKLLGRALDPGWVGSVKQTTSQLAGPELARCKQTYDNYVNGRTAPATDVEHEVLMAALANLREGNNEGVHVRRERAELHDELDAAFKTIMKLRNESKQQAATRHSTPWLHEVPKPPRSVPLVQVVAQPTRIPIPKYDTNLALLLCNALTSTGGATQAVISRINDEYEIALRGDSSLSEWTVSPNELLSDLTDRLASEARAAGFSLTSFDEMSIALNRDLNVIDSMHESLFLSGSRIGLLAQLDKVELGRTAAQVDEVLPREGHAEHNAKRLLSRLENAGFDLRRTLRFGESKLKALLSDLKASCSDGETRLAIILEGNDWYPETVLGHLSFLLHEVELAELSTIFVLGAPGAASRLSWPRDTVAWPDNTVSSVRVAELAAPCINDRRWHGVGYTTLEIAVELSPERGRLLSLALSAVAIGGCVDIDQLQLWFGMSQDEATWLSGVLVQHFGVHGVVPLDWRRHALNHLQRDDVVRLRSAIGKRWGDIPSLTSSLIAWALIQTLVTGNADRLDLVMAKLLRSDVSEVRYFESQLKLVASVIDLSDIGLNQALLLRAKIARDIATGCADRSSIVEYLDDRCRVLEGIIPDAALAAFYYQSGYFCYVDGRLAEADDLVTKALVLDSGSYRNCNLRGLISLARGDVRQASLYFEESIQLHNGYAYSHYNAGVAAERLKELPAAANHYIACLILQPDFYEAMFNLLNVLVELACFAEAATVAELAAALGPVCQSEVISNLAIGLLSACYSQVGLSLLKRADTLSPNNVVRYNIAVTYYARGQAEQCKAWLGLIDTSCMLPDQTKAVLQLKRLCKECDFSAFETNKTIIPKTAAAFKINFAVFQNYLRENGVRREVLVRRQVEEGLERGPKNPFKHAPKSIRERLLNCQMQSASVESSLKMREMRMGNVLGVRYMKVPSSTGG